MTDVKNKRLRYFFLGLLFDLVGGLSFIIPGIGEFSDVIWAPLAGWLMTRMYKGNIGKAAGVFTFLEEILPGLDVIPSFTLMWLYTFIIRKGAGTEIVNTGTGS